MLTVSDGTGVLRMPVALAGCDMAPMAGRGASLSTARRRCSLQKDQAGAPNSVAGCALTSDRVTVLDGGIGTASKRLVTALAIELALTSSKNQPITIPLDGKRRIEADG